MPNKSQRDRLIAVKALKPGRWETLTNRSLWTKIAQCLHFHGFAGLTTAKSKRRRSSRTISGVRTRRHEGAHLDVDLIHFNKGNSFAKALPPTSSSKI